MAITYHNFEEYSLISASQGTVIIPEPMNFEDGNDSIYERDSKSKGFLTSTSNKLEFFREAYDFLRKQDANKGVAEDVILRKRIKSDNRMDERWRVVKESYIDMGENQFDDTERSVKTKVTHGGLYEILNKKLKSNFDITSTLSIDNQDIGALETVSVELPSKEILLRSELRVPEGTGVRHIVTYDDGLVARAFPFQWDVNSDAEDITNVLGDNLRATTATFNYADLKETSVGNCFYTIADQPTTLTINGRVELRITDPGFGAFQIDLVRYSNGEEFNFNSIVENLYVHNHGAMSVDQTAIYEFIDYELQVEEGDSFTIGVLGLTDDDWGYTIFDSYLVIKENSKWPPTSSRAVTPFAMGERLVSIISGQNLLFRSSLLEDDHKLLTQGFWIRQFPDIVEEGTDDERIIPFKNSLGNFLEHVDLVSGPIAWWVEKEGNKEVMRVELLEYTQQNFIGIKFEAQASKVKRTALKDNYYGKIIIGSTKGGDGYEEISGLQSISGRAEWSTINKKSESEYKKESNYRLGDVDVELPRRKPYELFPETDTKYDSDIMCIDCYKVGNGYFLKDWQWDYEVIPKNIHKPGTAFNLSFTPARLLLKHGLEINVGLWHYSRDHIHFDSSNCNSSFTSKKSGEDELVENAAIPHALLENPKVKAMAVDLVLQVDQDLEDEITGTTNGVPNWFGLVAVNTGESIEYMRLIKSDVNKEGKHKLIESFITK